jgi:TetR/AcrR family transcriptional repressor of nem operon
MQIFFERGEVMRRSRSATAETRERIVSTASGLFLKKGLEAVGMRDIMSAAGLTPGGFYRHFESKEELIAVANQAAFDHLMAMFEDRTKGKSPAEALETIIFLYLNQSQHEGNTYLCPLSMVGAELGHCGLKVREVAMEGRQRLVQFVADRLMHLGKSEALTTASGVVSTMAGAVMLSNMAPDQATASAILKDAQVLIKTHFAPKKPRKG